MELSEIQLLYEAGKLQRGICKPCSSGNGWMIQVVLEAGEHRTLTDHSGKRHLYKSLDKATLLLKDIGFDEISIEEAF